MAIQEGLQNFERLLSLKNRIFNDIFSKICVEPNGLLVLYEIIDHDISIWNRNVLRLTYWRWESVDSDLLR